MVRLVPAVLFFQSLPKVYDNKWVSEHILNGKLRALPLVFSPSSSCTYCCHRTDPPIYVILWLALLVNKTSWVGSPAFSSWEPWIQIWRCWPSSSPRHTRPQTSQASTEIRSLTWSLLLLHFYHSALPWLHLGRTFECDVGWEHSSELHLYQLFSSHVSEWSCSDSGGPLKQPL